MKFHSKRELAIGLSLFLGAACLVRAQSDPSSDIAYNPDIPFLLSVNVDAKSAGSVRVRIWLSSSTQKPLKGEDFILPDIKEYDVILRDETYEEENLFLLDKIGIPISVLYDSQSDEPRFLFVRFDHGLHVSQRTKDYVRIYALGRNGDAYDVTLSHYSNLARDKSYIPIPTDTKPTGESSEKASSEETRDAIYKTNLIWHEIKYETPYNPKSKEGTSVVVFGGLDLWRALTDHTKGRDALHDLVAD